MYFLISYQFHDKDIKKKDLLHGFGEIIFLAEVKEPDSSVNAI
jgi:hypothetical protein